MHVKVLLLEAFQMKIAKHAPELCMASSLMAMKLGCLVHRDPHAGSVSFNRRGMPHADPTP